MGKGNGSTRASSSNSPRGMGSGFPAEVIAQAANELQSSINQRRASQPITNGYYDLDGRRVYIISNDEINGYKDWSKQQLREEAIRLNRVYADEPGRTKADYIGDILSARFGRNAIAESQLTKEQKKRLVRR